MAKVSIVITLIFLVYCVTVILSRPTYRSKIPNGLNVPCPEGQEEACAFGLCEGLGHQSCRGGGQRNSFGIDFFKAEFDWNLELCKKDSDGDGVPNGVELGDPCCLFIPEVADIFPKVEYQLSHPGLNSSIPDLSPQIDFAYCQAVSNSIEERRMSRYTQIFQEGEVQLQKDFQLTNFSIPSDSDTTYAYPRFSFPSDKEYDLVAIQPLVDPQTSQFVHHFVVYACHSEWQGENGQIVWAGEAVGSTGVDPSCYQVLWGWAPGVNSLIAPPNAGFHIGKNSPVKSFMIEVHFDNPELKTDVFDNSGVRMYLTERSRPWQFMAIMVGPVYNIPAFPNGQKNYYVSSAVPVAQINESIAPEGVTVFASVAHAHMYGRKVFSSIFRRNKQSGNSTKFLGYDEEYVQITKDIDNAPAFSFANQRNVPVFNVSLKNGDYIGMSCVYDTTSASEPVQGGPGSRDEMCVDFIYVYPVEALNVSGFTTPILTPYMWIGRVTTGIANENARSMQTVGIKPWLDLQSHIDRIGCPGMIATNFSNLTETIQILERACGFQDLEYFVSQEIQTAFVALSSLYNNMTICSQQCGVLLSASIGCLVSRYGSVNKDKEGWQIEHAEFPDLQSLDDVFYLAYWWSLYHNFPQVCDQHLDAYIMADSNQEDKLISTIANL